MKTAAKKEPRRRNEPAARVVYTQAPVQLAVLVAREGELFRVRIGATESLASVDPAVDPALLAQCLADGARVVLDASGPEPVIAGVLTTRRALTMDRDGDVDARVRAFTVTAEREATLKTPGAFLQLGAHEAELYATRVVARAREIARVLGRMVKLN